VKFGIDKTCFPPLVASEGGSLWVVSGCIPHADEDTTFAILADDEQQACDAFEEALWEDRDAEEKPEVIMGSGSAVYINFSSVLARRIDV
jgi:hypothetical protein